MPTTSNFGWTTPADTDLVKDGAAAIRTLGNGIDTSLVDLKGGTTGQILSKNSNTDLDYTWVTPNVGDITEVQAGTGISVASGTGPVPVVTNTVATTFDAKGDLVVGTGADTFAKLTVGTNDYVLTAASGETTGLKWAAASSPAYAWTSYTPTLNGLTQGNGTLNASYVRIGNKTMIVRIDFTFGSTSSVTGAVSFTMPSGATVEKMVEGKVALNDAGSNFHQGTSFVLPGDSNIYVYADKADGTYLNTVVLSSTVPHTWATNDYIRFILLWQES